MTLFPGDGTGTSSFGSVHFWLQQPGTRTVPRRGKTVIYERTKIPYGNDAVLEIGGLDAPPMQRQVLIKDADWASMLGLLGTTGTLALFGDSSTTATLVDWPHGEFWAEGYVTVQAKWEF